MFKIIEPNIFNVDKVKYSLIDTSYIDNYKIEDEKINLNKCIRCSNTIFSKDIININNITSSTFEDVIFEQCDLSNVTFINCNFYRVIFKNCKMLGTSFIDCGFYNVKILESNCKLLNLSSNIFKCVLISSTNLTESNISNNKFNLLELSYVNLCNSEIVNTKLSGIDLSTCNIEGIFININDLKDTIIRVDQAMDLINILGVKIKE